ncbi:acyl-CoA dehydrogenase family protein [Reichenbachiella agariperforans]|uniref:acyl-CoA dehydrogenase family protein n=1 Tax=Reichenbachiella agariperforans TaxID=156994 RepID=UPI001C0912A2|nr:acyl-CoA dehydrogenase family protein [Reichenbachiella agariperforans]MBU2913705.1 acyl-CoA dehydrogenase family protein [Reichenbachiella agariperforans]
MEAQTAKRSIKGGEFLIRETAAADIFIPSEFTEEQKMMAQATKDFIDKEIQPVREKIEKQEGNIVPDLMTKAGELGLLGVSIPEAYGGLGMNFNTSMLIADIIGETGSFSTTYGAHTGIGTLPILYYGTEEQKKKYLPLISSGEWKSCYCLTEPDAGSDANSGKTKATLSDDGKHYLINGQKMWISNAGFADLFIVFAKIDDDKKLTAFIVEKTFGGITMNDEEVKLGIKGSSTRQVFFNDCKVPVENMLSDRENGFKIAVNILNIGRIKLGAGVLGGCKEVANYSVNYANERKQFNTAISSFGAIKHKLAEMAIQTWVTEAASYRAGQNIDDCIADLIADGMEDGQAKLKSFEQFSIECAIIKIIGSEALDYVVDQGVQIYGGMGFSEDAPMARAYRDARITRIYEGTNEINRMLMVGMILKRAMKGELNIMEPAMAVAKELTAVPSFDMPDMSKPFAEEKEVLKRLKKSVLMVAGKAAQTFGPAFETEQEIMMNVADMMIQIYAAESAVLRAEKLVSIQGAEASKLQINAAKVYLYDAADKINKAGKDAIASFTTGDEQKVMLMGLKRFTKTNPVNVKALRREIADQMIAENKYTL